MKAKNKFIILNMRLPLLPCLCIVAAGLAAIVLFQLNFSSTEALSPSLFGLEVVIDPGHGDWDPGVVGSSGITEKEINLAISHNLAELLRNSGARVQMTREGDTALGDTKGEDIKARCAIAENADIFISIHINSYPAYPSIKGAQMFFGTDNPQGKLLAELLQSRAATELGSNRTALVHKDAYLLKNITIPSVIAEMGFLSNSEELANLSSSDYQWQAAWALYMGIVDYCTNDV